MNLSGSTATNTNFSGVNFTNAQLYYMNLTSANLDDVIWSNTVCPDGTNSNDNDGTCIGHLDPSTIQQF
jgi:uncharacterized protein YjbI with pentapeptide repeats